MSLYQQAAALANQQMKGSSLGSLGGSYDSMF